MKQRFRDEESGQAIVEFALTLPILLLLLCGILELGWVCSNKLMLSNICHEGVRSGITYQADGGNTEIVCERIRALATADVRDKLEVSVRYSNATDPQAGDMTVTLVYNMPTLTPLPGMAQVDTFQIESSCTMKMG